MNYDIIYNIYLRRKIMDKKMNLKGKVKHRGFGCQTITAR